MTHCLHSLFIAVCLNLAVMLIDRVGICRMAWHSYEGIAAL